MAEEFDDFEDFDSDIASAAAEEANQEEEVEQPAPAAPVAKKQFGRKPLAQPVPPVAPQRPVQPAARVQTPAPAPEPVRKSKAMGAAPIAQDRYSAYSAPKRFGIIDNVTGQIHAEHEDVQMLLLGLIVEMKNDINDIKESLI